MEPTTLGNSASGGHDDSPFAKGYQAGFQHGWNQGFRRGKQEGRREAAPQTRSREGDDAAEGSEEAQGRRKFLFYCALLPALAPSCLVI